jgi:hypothetical protein
MFILYDIINSHASFAILWILMLFGYKCDWNADNYFSDMTMSWMPLTYSVIQGYRLYILTFYK